MKNVTQTIGVNSRLQQTLRQAFAIAKSGIEYNVEYRSPMPKCI